MAKKKIQKLAQEKSLKVQEEDSILMKIQKILLGLNLATPADARATVRKVKRINKPYARKIQILTVMEQRAKVMKKQRWI